MTSPQWYPSLDELGGVLGRGFGVAEGRKYTLHMGPPPPPHRKSHVFGGSWEVTVQLDHLGYHIHLNPPPSRVCIWLAKSGEEQKKIQANHY